MKKQYKACPDQSNYESFRALASEDILVLLDWIEEHTRLCFTAGSANCVDGEQLKRFRTCILNSQQRGNQMVVNLVKKEATLSSTADVYDSEGVRLNSELGYPVPNFRVPSAIPISGIRRFDEVNLSSQSLNLTSIQKRSVGNSVSADFSLKIPQSVPLPSRTYLKKSGT